MALLTVFYIFGCRALIAHYLPGKYLREEGKRNGRRLLVPVSEKNNKSKTGLVTYNACYILS